MNTAVRIVTTSTENVLHWAEMLPLISLAQLRALLLLAAILVSAFSIVYIKDLNRRLFIQNQMLENAHDQIQLDWGKLLLEQGAWSTQSRTQELAQSTLNMRVPKAEEIVLIKTK